MRICSSSQGARRAGVRPHRGGCDTCTGVVTVGPGQTVTQNAEYYTLGHLARFVPPGAVRIASTSFGTTCWNGQVMDAAFRDARGDTALVAHNENDGPRTFAVAQGGWSFDYTLPGGALATFTWPASAALDDRLVLLDAHATSASASPAGEPEKAVDDDATTRWTTGTAQQPGQYLQVDLGRSEADVVGVASGDVDVAVAAQRQGPPVVLEQHLRPGDRAAGKRPVRRSRPGWCGR